MPAPWEKYQSSAAPWERYAQPKTGEIPRNPNPQPGRLDPSLYWDAAKATGKEIGRQGLLTAETIGKGVVNATAGPFADALAATGNIIHGAATGQLHGATLQAPTVFPSTGEVMNRGAESLGLPKPETMPERVADVGGQIMTGIAVGGPFSRAVMGRLGLPVTPAAQQAVPTTKQLKQYSQSAYNAVEKAGVTVKNKSLADAVDDIGKLVTKEGIDPTLHPGATAALGRLQSAAKTGQDLSFSDLETLRRVIKNAADTNSDSERRLAMQMANKLDDFVAALKPSDVTSGDASKVSGLISTARDLWSRASKAEDIENMIERARIRAPNFSASGMENALRVEFRQLALNASRLRRFSPAEQEAIIKVAKGGPVQNALRMLGKLAPTGVISGALSGGAGYVVGGPVGAATMLGAGQASRLGATWMTLKNAELAAQLARSGGTLPAGGGVLAPSVGPMIGAVGPTAEMVRQLRERR